MKCCKLILTLTVLAFLLSGNAHATDYFICDCATGADPNCIVGNDANDGLSPTTPWQSTSMVGSIINTLQAGDQILFAKGGSWTNAAMGNLYNFNSTGSNPIVFDSYTPSWGGSAKPILSESTVDINLFSFVDGGDADHDEGYVVRNLDLRGNGTAQWAVFAYNDADYIHLENLDIQGFEIGVHCAGANPPNPGADYQNQHMTLLNSTIIDCSGQGFLGGADFLRIEGCHFENNGFAQAIFNHNIYLSNGNHVVIRNNELYRSAVVDGMAHGTSLVVHGTLDDLLIEGNYVHEDAGFVTGHAWGIAVDPGYDSAESFTNVIIRGNLLVNMFNIGIGVTSAPGAIIENNVIINESSGDLVAIAAPDRLRGDNDAETTNVTVRNNSIYLRNANVFTVGISVGDEGNGHVVASNVISLDGGNGFEMNLIDADYAGVDNNMMELLNNANWGAGQDLSSWSMSRGFDLQSLTGDPQFTSPGAPDHNLIPLSSSPLIDAGHPTLSSSIDNTGAPRIGVADIGAYEIFTVDISEGLVGLEWQVVSCFPNPTNDQIHLISDNSMVGTAYTIYNCMGQSLMAGKVVSSEMVLDLGDYSAGIYYVVMGVDQAIKVIKE